MNWPWTRPAETKIVVVHELGPETLKALRGIAEASRLEQRRRTDAMAQLLPEQQPPEPEKRRRPPPADVEFDAWLAAQDLSPEEREDIYVMREHVLDRRQATAEQKSRARRVLAAVGAPMERI